MPKYKANRDTWISHECRQVKAGEVFSTEFPKIKAKDGSESEMKITDNLTLCDDEGNAVAEKKGRKAADLV